MCLCLQGLGPLHVAPGHVVNAQAFEELAPDEAVEVRIISTTGDQRLEISLAEIGGKGLFTRELDVALASKEVDFCVHSTKDVPTELIPDTELCTMLPREDAASHSSRPVVSCHSLCHSLCQMDWNHRTRGMC